MAFSLIDDDAGAVPVDLVSKAGFSRWREMVDLRERDWTASVGFAGDAGKLALVPGGDGRVAGLAAARHLPARRSARRGRCEPDGARLDARDLFVRSVPPEKEGSRSPAGLA